MKPGVAASAPAARLDCVHHAPRRTD
jgi:hypothetical protein